MSVPDVNLLIYAYDASSPWHERARNWWEDALCRHGHGLVRFFQASPLFELPQDWLRREDDNGRRAEGMGVELQTDERRCRINRPTESKITGPLTQEEAEAIIDGKGPWRLDELSDADGQVLLDALCPKAPDGSVLLDDERDEA